MSTDIPRPPAASRRRRLLVAVGSALVVVALVVLGFVLGGDDETAAAADGGAAATSSQPAHATAGAPSAGAPSGSAPSGDAPSGSAPSGSAPETSAPPPVTPAPTGPTGDVDAPPPAQPAVALDQPAAVGDGVTASITSIEPIQGTGTGRGNVAGPALRVAVRIDNGTAKPVSLDGVTVGLTSGDDHTPASPLDDPSQVPFAGTVRPGDTADGTYVFSIAEDARDAVTVTVGYRAGAPILVFTGSAR
jgi:hypothetical protein